MALKRQSIQIESTFLSRGGFLECIAQNLENELSNAQRENQNHNHDLALCKLRLRTTLEQLTMLRIVGTG